MSDFGYRIFDCRFIDSIIIPLMNLSKNTIWALIISVFFAGGFLLTTYLGRNDGNKMRAKFIEANIHARLRKVDRNSRFPIIAFENDNNEYYTNFSIDAGNENHNFAHLAKVGDSVAKEMNSDTLYLFKGSKMYIYTE